MTQSWGLYIHSPFCTHKCGYCDFNSWGESSLAPQLRWKESILRQAQFWAKRLPANTQFDTLFWGGGTPSLLDNSVIESFLLELEKIFNLAPNAERSMEANPETLNEEKLKLFSDLGINRLSVGIQSFSDKNLERLERHARRKDNFKALELIAKVWKGRWSLDLMFALPEQTMDEWEGELTTALEFSPQHLSAYQLTLSTERSKNWKQAGNDELSKFFDFTEEKLGANGFSRYEVSNFCLSGQECQHNLKYWRVEPFLGLGPGASGLLRAMPQLKESSFHQKSPDNFDVWAEHAGREMFELKTLSPRSSRDDFHERLMMGLRLKKGISISVFNDEELGVLMQKLSKPELRDFFVWGGDGQLSCRPSGLKILDTLLLKLFEL